MNLSLSCLASPGFCPVTPSLSDLYQRSSYFFFFLTTVLWSFMRATPPSINLLTMTTTSLVFNQTSTPFTIGLSCLSATVSLSMPARLSYGHFHQGKSLSQPLSQHEQYAIRRSKEFPPSNFWASTSLTVYPGMFAYIVSFLWSLFVFSFPFLYIFVIYLPIYLSIYLFI